MPLISLALDPTFTGDDRAADDPDGRSCRPRARRGHPGSPTGVTPKTAAIQGDGDVLTAEFVAHVSEPSERLTRLIDYVKANPTSFKSPFATSGP